MVSVHLSLKSQRLIFSPRSIFAIPINNLLMINILSQIFFRSKKLIRIFRFVRLVII